MWLQSRLQYTNNTTVMYMIGNWKMVLDKRGFAGAVRMDLLKAFDTINYELLIAKIVM